MIAAVGVALFERYSNDSVRNERRKGMKTRWKKKKSKKLKEVGEEEE